MTHRHLLSCAAALALLCAGPLPAVSGPVEPTSDQQPSDTYAVRVGEFRIASLSDGTVPLDLHKLLTGTTEAEIDTLLRKSFLANPVEASINVFLVRGAGRTVLVDTGSGHFFGPGFGGRLLDGLADVGVKPEEVTDILISHVHTDHTGGLVADGRSVFSNATVHVGAPDVEFFVNASHKDKASDEAAGTIGVYANLGKVKAFDHDETVLPGLVASLHPGHTPGSAFFTLSSAGRSIVFIGDIIHAEAIQPPKPSVTMVYDVDPAKAASVREHALADFAASSQLVAAPHLPFPGIGHVRAEGDGSFTWHAVEYRNRID